MAASRTVGKKVEHRREADAQKPKPRPIRLDDLLPRNDVRGGSRKAFVFGQPNSSKPDRE
jgi:hypothetical protein